MPRTSFALLAALLTACSGLQEPATDPGPVLNENLFPTGSPPQPIPGLPGLVLDPFQVVLLIDGTSCPSFGCGTVLPGGTLATFLLPPGLTGQTILIQGFALPSAFGTPANGFFAATDAHEVTMQ